MTTLALHGVEGHVRNPHPRASSGYRGNFGYLK